MRERLLRSFRPSFLLIPCLLVAGISLAAQQPEGPQTSAPPPVAPAPPTSPTQGARSNEKILVPAGTRIGVVLENGIYLVGLAIAKESPLLIEMGSLLDVLFAVLVMGVAIFHIGRTFDSIEVDQLSTLKD